MTDAFLTDLFLLLAFISGLLILFGVAGLLSLLLRLIKED